MLSWANQLFRSLAIENIEIETEILQNERRLWDGHTVYLIYVTSSQWTMFDDSSLPTSQYPNNRLHSPWASWLLPCPAPFVRKSRCPLLL